MEASIAEAVALAEEMEALDPDRTWAELGQATEADEPLTLGSESLQPPLLRWLQKFLRVCAKFCC